MRFAVTLALLSILPVSYGFAAGPAVSSGDPEMGGSAIRRSRPADPAATAPFRSELSAAGDNLRPVYEKYLTILGAETMLDVVEEMAPACHAQAHDLGRVIFAATGDLSRALEICGNRCTSGCMHGVIGEALGEASAEEIEKRLGTFCDEGTMARIHKRGNCAHALGHAIMFVTGRDVGASLALCEKFPEKPMRYYCGTGVFMEYLVTGRDPALRFESLHAPCDRYPRYAAACYRFRANDILAIVGGDFRRFGEACATADASLRPGCFHGLGAAAVETLFKDPARLKEICALGGEADRSVCIEGAVEKLAEYDRGKAAAACSPLPKPLRAVCRSAAAAGLYRLDKETFPLLYDPALPVSLPVEGQQ